MYKDAEIGDFLEPVQTIVAFVFIVYVVFTIRNSIRQTNSLGQVKSIRTRRTGISSVPYAPGNVQLEAFPSRLLVAMGAGIALVFGRVSLEGRAVLEVTGHAVSLVVDVPVGQVCTTRAFIIVVHFCFAVQGSVRQTVFIRIQIIRVIFVARTGETKAISAFVFSVFVLVAVPHSVSLASASFFEIPLFASCAGIGLQSLDLAIQQRNRNAISTDLGVSLETRVAAVFEHSAWFGESFAVSGSERLAVLLTVAVRLQVVLGRAGGAVVRIRLDRQAIPGSVLEAVSILQEEPIEASLALVFVFFKRFAEVLRVGVASVVFNVITRSAFGAVIFVGSELDASWRVSRDALHFVGRQVEVVVARRAPQRNGVHVRVFRVCNRGAFDVVGAVGNMRKAFEFVVRQLETGNAFHTMVARVAFFLTKSDVQRLVPRPTKSFIQVELRVITFQAVFGAGIELQAPVYFRQFPADVLLQIVTRGAPRAVVGGLVSLAVGDSSDRVRLALLGRAQEVARLALDALVERRVFGAEIDCSFDALVHRFCFVKRR